MGNNEQSNLWCIVIDAPKDEKSPKAVLGAYLTSLKSLNASYFISSIIHDKDLLEDGTPKLVHLHVFIDLGADSDNSPLKCTKASILNEISAFLSISKEQISVRSTENNFLYIQYLCHKNDTDKWKYDFEDINTNNPTLLVERYNKVYQAPKRLEEQEILNFLQNDKYVQDLIAHIGLNQTLKYKAIFESIKKEQREQKEVILHATTREQALYEQLQNAFEDLKEAEKYKVAFADLLHNCRVYLTKEAYSALKIEFILKDHGLTSY